MATKPVVAFMGDSYTYHYSLGEVASGMAPYLAEKLLLARGANVVCRNFGSPGETSGQMLVRIASMVAHEVPEIAVIYAGANDPACDTTTASASSSTEFTVQSAAGANFKVGTWVKVGGVSGYLVTNVSTDTLTISPALGGTPSNGTAVIIDTQANITSMGQYLLAAGVTRLLVGLMHYWNLSSGGDTLDTPLPANVTLRTAQQAAATALGAATADHYTEMRQRVVDSSSATTTVAASPAPTVLGLSVGSGKGQYYTAGRALTVNSQTVVVASRVDDALTFETPLTRIPIAGDAVTSPDTELSGSWHVLATNTHQNAYGSRIMAQVYDAAIAAQAGWLAALS